MSATTLYLGEIWHTPSRDELAALPSGALAVDAGGRILDLGPAAAMRTRFPDARVVDHGDALILPGFVDAHVHFPQIDMIGSYGEQLLGWLDAYTYPQELKFADATFAA